MALSATRVRRIEFNLNRIITRNNRVLSQVLNDLTGEIEAEYKHRLSAKQAPPPSKRGQIPARDSGQLVDNTHVIRKGREIIVTTLQYGVWLDGGTSTIAARPWIRRLLHNRRAYWSKRTTALLHAHSKGR